MAGESAVALLMGEPEGPGSAPGGAGSPPAEGGGASAPPDVKPDVKPDASGKPEDQPGSAFAHFAEGMSEDERRALGKFKSAQDLGRSYLELQRLQGRMVPLPGEKSTPEEIKAFRQRLGVPEDPTGYQFEGLPSVEDGWNPELEAQARAFFHAEGYTPKQAQAAMSFYLDLQNKEKAVIDDLTRETMEGLKKEWGGAYNTHMANFRAALSKYFDGETIRWLGQTQLGSYPGLIKGLAALGADLRSGGYVKSDPGVTNVQDARAAIRAIDNDKTHPYHVKTHPEHWKAVEARFHLEQAALIAEERP